MGFLDVFLWVFAVFAIAYGIGLLVLPEDKLMPTIKKQLLKKGNSNPSEEELKQKLKTFRILGGVCIGAGLVLVLIQATGGI